MKWWENSAERKDLIEEIITLRASFLIDKALRGLRIDFDRALDILRNRNAFISAREQQQHEILVAAVENLIDFAVAEEMTMLGALPEQVSETNLAECEEVCRRYNLVYAQKENEQVGLAAAMAAWWMAVSEDTLVTFMTQRDERVRPWHLSFEGISYRKSEFPPELIPPIEWGCRCYLVANGFASVHASVSRSSGHRKVDPVFRESLATGGRIFSDAHPYFSTPLPEFAVQTGDKLKKRFHYA